MNTYYLMYSIYLYLYCIYAYICNSMQREHVPRPLSCDLGVPYDSKSSVIPGVRDLFWTVCHVISMSGLVSIFEDMFHWGEGSIASLNRQEIQGISALGSSFTVVVACWIGKQCKPHKNLLFCRGFRVCTLTTVTSRCTSWKYLLFPL